MTTGGNNNSHTGCTRNSPTPKPVSSTRPCREPAPSVDAFFCPLRFRELVRLGRWMVRNSQREASVLFFFFFFFFFFFSLDPSVKSGTHILHSTLPSPHVCQVSASLLLRCQTCCPWVCSPQFVGHCEVRSPCCPGSQNSILTRTCMQALTRDRTYLTRVSAGIFFFLRQGKARDLGFDFVQEPVHGRAF